MSARGTYENIIWIGVKVTLYEDQCDQKRVYVFGHSVDGQT